MKISPEQSQMPISVLGTRGTSTRTIADYLNLSSNEIAKNRDDINLKVFVLYISSLLYLVASGFCVFNKFIFPDIFNEKGLQFLNLGIYTFGAGTVSSAVVANVIGPIADRRKIKKRERYIEQFFRSEGIKNPRTL